MIKVAICDDDVTYSEFIQESVCLSYPGDEVIVHKFDSTIDLIRCNHSEFDIIFLDYIIDDLNGIDVAKIIRKSNMYSVIVFITGETEPTPILFELGVSRFIKKTVDKDNVIEDIRKISMAVLKRKQREYIFVDVIDRSVGNHSCRIELRKVIYISKNLKGSKIFMYDSSTKETSYIRCREKLNELYDRVNHCFAMPHSSYIVNMDNISRIYTGEIELVNGESLNISKSKRNSFIEKVSIYSISGGVSI